MLQDLRFGFKLLVKERAFTITALPARAAMWICLAGGAVALTRLMTKMRFDVKPAEPGVDIAVAVALMAVALVASLAPSLRLIRMPAAALRYE
jgi:hypothetical protein